jgi:hypothetical protein
MANRTASYQHESVTLKRREVVCFLATRGERILAASACSGTEVNGTCFGEQSFRSVDSSENITC